jgi:hypothetical protein
MKTSESSDPVRPGVSCPMPGSGRPESAGAETVDNSRNAIAPADTTITGTVLPAGWERKTAAARPAPVLIRSAISARTSWPAGSRGP